MSAAADICPLSAARWADFETVLGASGKSGCWCMYWRHATSAAFRAGAEGGAEAANRDAFRARVEEGPPPGLLAYQGGEPVAWARVTPRADLPGLARSRNFRIEGAGEGIWSLSCFVARPRGRGTGLTEALPRAALAFAAEGGATALEVYPTEIDRAAARRPASAIYTGVSSTFLRLGFEVVARRTPDRPLMRRRIGSERCDAP
ncbi:MAG: GNAT family N-acetyltransferase [Paracoccaceae bacterium]